MKFQLRITLFADIFLTSGGIINHASCIPQDMGALNWYVTVTADSLFGFGKSIGELLSNDLRRIDCLLRGINLMRHEYDRKTFTQKLSNGELIIKPINEEVFY